MTVRVTVEEVRMISADIPTHTEQIHQEADTVYKFQSDFKQFIVLLPAPLGPRTTILMPLVITKLQSLKIDGGASSVEASSPSSTIQTLCRKY